MRRWRGRMQAARQADRTARGEADHSLQGLLLYGLSTIFMSAMMILVKLLGAHLCFPQPAVARCEGMTFAFCDMAGPLPGLTCISWVAGRWGISVFIVLFIRSMTVLILALSMLWRDGDNPWGNR